MTQQITQRQYDRHRCECRTSTGGRCQNKTTYIATAQDDTGTIQEYGSCKRHRTDFVVRDLGLAL